MTRNASVLAVALAGLSLTACSSIIKGTSQEINIVTEPAGAVCEVQRDGRRIGGTNPTPGPVKVSKSKDDLAVHCQKQGYQNQTEYAQSSFDPVMLGNILLGGIIGMGIDFGTGAYVEYPDSVFVRLAPAEFGAAPAASPSGDSPATRRDQINADADAAIAKIRAQCTGGGYSNQTCIAAVSAINEERARLLAGIDG